MPSIKNVSKTYRDLNSPITALQDINLNIIDTGIVFLIGESGSGKSTLLRILAGLDTEYTGTLDITDTPYYIDSDYDLFNELTVIENLALTRNSLQRVRSICARFNLTDLLNKKAKVLSNGEKRRIQLIKAFLTNSKTILMDEICSAMDYDNLFLMMDLLKIFSNNHLIIIATHNDTLVDKYADQIIELNNGRLINNQIIHFIKGSPKLFPVQTMKRKDIIRSLFAYTKELLGYKVPLTCLAILTVICSTSSISLFINTNQNTIRKQIIENNNATLTAVPLNTSSTVPNKYGVYQTIYDQYNSFYYRDISTLIAENESIIAISPYYSFKYSEFSPASNNEGTYTLTRNRSDLQINFPSFTGMMRSGPHEDIDYIISEPYYMDQEHCDTYACSKFTHTNDRDSQVITNKVNVFNLVNDYQNEIQLLYGDFGTNPQEIVIDYSLAEKLLSLYKLDSMETLIGHEFILNVVRNSNIFSIERIYTMSIPAYDLSSLDDQYIHPPYESVSFTISGITEYDNKLENNAYLTGSILENPLLSNFLSNTDHMNLPFRTLNIMVKPDTDMNLMKEELNLYFNLDQSEFKLISELGMIQSSDQSYNINTPTIIISLLVTIISLCTFIFTTLKNRNRVKKTITLLDRMDYNRYYLVISQSIDFILITLISFLINFVMKLGLKQIGTIFKLAQLIELNYGMMILSSIFLSLLSIYFNRPSTKH